MRKSTLIAPVLPSFTALIVLALTACSDSNNDSSAEAESTGGTLFQTSGGTVPARLKTMSLDFEDDGTINEVWTYSYDSTGRITSREISDIDNPANNRTITFNYEGNNLVSKVSSSGPQVTHVYNSAGQVISTQRDEDRMQEYGYDSRGRLISSTGSDAIGNCDDDDQPVSVDDDGMPASFDEVPTVSYSFTYQGNLLSVITDDDGSHAIEFVYNDQGRIRSLIENCGSQVEINTNFSYNENNQLTNTDYFELDTAFDEFIEIDPSTTTFNYNEKGLIESSTATDSFATTTTTFTHTPEGYPLTQETVIVLQASSLFPQGAQVAQSTMFEYEDASCQIAFTTNPNFIPFLDVFLQGRNINTPQDCIYEADRREL